MNESTQNKDLLEVLGRAKGYSKKELLNELTRHSNCTQSLLSEVKKQPEVILRNSGTPAAKRILKMMKELSLEAYRAIQFTRTEINNKGVLYGVVSLKHNVMDRILDYFHKRWPMCVICLFNEHDNHTSLINEDGLIRYINSSLEKIVKEISRKRPSIPYFEDIQFTGKEIFKTLYESQHIKERYNKRYFKKMIPDYCYKLPGMRLGVEKRFTPNNRKLDKYL